MGKTLFLSLQMFDFNKHMGFGIFLSMIYGISYPKIKKTHELL